MKNSAALLFRAIGLGQRARSDVKLENTRNVSVDILKRIKI